MQLVCVHMSWQTHSWAYFWLACLAAAPMLWLHSSIRSCCPVRPSNRFGQHIMLNSQCSTLNSHIKLS